MFTALASRSQALLLLLFFHLCLRRRRSLILLAAPRLLPRESRMRRQDAENRFSHRRISMTTRPSLCISSKISELQAQALFEDLLRVVENSWQHLAGEPFLEERAGKIAGARDSCSQLSSQDLRLFCFFCFFFCVCGGGAHQYFQPLRASRARWPHAMARR